jgi:hypothetical protein
VLTDVKKEQDVRDYARVDDELTMRMSRRSCDLGRGPGRINYGLWIAVTSPFLLLALLAGLFELFARTDGAATAWVARPFLWSVERGRSISRRIGR